MRISSFASPFAPLEDVSEQLVNRICPLFVLKGERQPLLIGTGIPIQIGSVSVIATAAHVLARVGVASVLTFGPTTTLLLSGERRGFGHRKGKFADVDLAVILLTDEERNLLRQRYTFSYSLDYSLLPPAQKTAFYTLIGFPYSRNKASPRLLRETYGEAVYFIMHQRLSVAAIDSADKFSSIHFALAAPSKYVTSPAGLSGGGVWWLDSSKSLAAAPIPRLVGIGIEYWRRPGAFICTGIREIDVMVRDLQR